MVNGLRERVKEFDILADIFARYSANVSAPKSLTANVRLMMVN